MQDETIVLDSSQPPPATISRECSKARYNLKYVQKVNPGMVSWALRLQINLHANDRYLLRSVKPVSPVLACTRPPSSAEEIHHSLRSTRGPGVVARILFVCICELSVRLLQNSWTSPIATLH